MKVLLAPLFFHSRKCKHCARIFYRNNPGSWAGIYEFEALPPLGSFHTGRGFIPDFPTLLMFDEFVVDGEALERLKQPGDRLWLREWSEAIAVLESEGSIVEADINAAARARAHQRGQMLRADLKNPQRWWQAIRYHNTLIRRAAQLLGDNPQEAENLSWEFDPDVYFGVPGEDGRTHDLGVVLCDAGRSEVQAHRDLLVTAINSLRGPLREVNACLVACSELDVAPIMWAPYRRFLEEKLRPSQHPNATDLQIGSHQFFEVAFPAHAPTTVGAFAKLRSDKRIKALRAEVLRASQKGELLDREYPQRVLTEVLRLEQSIGRVRRIAGWIATAIGTIPVPGVGVATAGIAEGITSVAERRRRHPWHWFYLISNGRGAT